MVPTLRRFLRRRARRGFTLLELAIVVLVIGIIMGLVLYNLQKATGVMDSAKALKVQGQSVSLPMDLERFLQAGGTANPGEDISGMAQDVPNSDWKPIPEQMLKDPWGNYYIICKGKEGADRICSYGKDKQEGGEGENADFQLDDRSTWPDWIKKK